MSAHDLERGIETYQPDAATAQSQFQMQPPTRPYVPREATVSPSQLTNRLSNYPSGMMQLDSPLLVAFRYHIGIHNDPSLSAPKNPLQAQGRDGLTSRSLGDVVSNVATSISGANTAVSTGLSHRPAPNLGIYQRVIAAERKYHREYQIFSVLINGALGLQIIFAAALTALGAANGSHNAVTAFGALNTVLAGLLTFLKGSGLPNRLKYYENEWIKVREYIEQRERDFASDSALGNLSWYHLTEEIHHIESMYEGVRKDIEANTPDSYVSMSNAMKTVSGGTNNQTRPGLARGMSRLQNKADAAEEDARRMGQTVSGRITSGMSEYEHRAGKSWGNLEKQATVNIREVAEDCREQVRDAGKQAEYHVTNAQNSVRDGFHRTQSSMESRMNDAHGAMRSKINESQNRFEEAQHHAESKAKEIEDKCVSAAEKAAEKVLEFTNHRHH